MSAQAWLQIILTLAAIFLVSIPLGRYMARVVTGRPTKFDRIFNPIDHAIYFLIGRRVASQVMTWKTYTIHMLVTNLVMAVIIYLVSAAERAQFPGSRSLARLQHNDQLHHQYELAGLWR
jgi:K+-transporting ATPase A subunit